MLQPKRTKYRKAFKGRIRGAAKGGFNLDFGAFGLKAMEPDRLTARQIEAARIAAQKEIAAMQVAANSAVNKEKMARQTAIDTAKLGIDAAKHKENLAHQRQQSIRQMVQQKPAPTKEKS